MPYLTLNKLTKEDEKNKDLEAIAIVKSEARDKSVRYKFAPSTAARW